MEHPLLKRLLRRREVLEGAARCAVAGAGLCLLGQGCRSEPPVPAGPLELGPLASFSPGVNDLSVYRVAVVCEPAGERLRFGAVSLLCTHQTCIVRTTRTASLGLGGFRCPCHGSTFSETGEVVSGPAPKPLPWYQLEATPEGTLLLHRDRVVSPSWRLEV